MLLICNWEDILENNSSGGEGVYSGDQGQNALLTVLLLTTHSHFHVLLKPFSLQKHTPFSFLPEMSSFLFWELSTSRIVDLEDCPVRAQASYFTAKETEFRGFWLAQVHAECVVYVLPTAQSNNKVFFS